MKTLYFLLEKEFRQLLRNRQLMRTLLLAPLIQLILLPLAADYTVKDIHIAVTDNDHSPSSQRLIAKITASGYFRLAGYTASYPEALRMVEEDKADLALQIPAHFERDLVRENTKQLYIAINAIEGTKANLGGAYARASSAISTTISVSNGTSVPTKAPGSPAAIPRRSPSPPPTGTTPSSNFPFTWYPPFS